MKHSKDELATAGLDSDQLSLKRKPVSKVEFLEHTRSNKDINKVSQEVRVDMEGIPEEHLDVILKMPILSVLN